MKYYTYILKQDGFIQNPICQNQLKKYPVNRDEDEDDKRQFKKYSLDTIHVLGNANPNTVAFFSLLNSSTALWLVLFSRCTSATFRHLCLIFTPSGKCVTEVRKGRKYNIEK